MTRSTPVFLTVLLFVLSSTSATYEDFCPDNYNMIGDTCYRLLASRETRSEAKSSCIRDDAKLLELEDQVHLDGVLNLINQINPGQFWVGGYMGTPNSYKWEVSQTTVQFPMRGRSFNGVKRCVYLCSFTNKLWDGVCSSTKKFICMKRQPEIISDEPVY